jgi:DNA-binding NarL/FixJ family response regulator
VSAHPMHPHQLITVLIAVDHALFREGIRLFLAEQVDVEVVGEAAEGVQMRRLLEALRPHVLVLDLQLPAVGRLENLAAIQGLSPRTKVLLLSTQLGDEVLSEALQQGAHGYLPKTATRPELLKAIRALAAGEIWAPRTLLTLVVERLRQRLEARQGLPWAVRAPLTGREREIVQGILQGLTNREIAAQLGISEKTVKAHLSSVFRKLNVRRRVDLFRAPPLP